MNKRYKVSFTEQSKAWTAAVSVEGDTADVLEEALELTKKAKKQSGLLTLDKIRGK